MTRACWPLLASAGKNAGPTGQAPCHLVSPCVAPEKDSKPPGWEVGCVTYPRDGNILNPLDDKDLWNMRVERKAFFMSFYVRASNLRNGKPAARRSREVRRAQVRCSSRE
jgi:hypothetical protein